MGQQLATKMIVYPLVSMDKWLVGYVKSFSIQILECLDTSALLIGKPKPLNA